MVIACHDSDRQHVSTSTNRVRVMDEEREATTVEW